LINRQIKMNPMEFPLTSPPYCRCYFNISAILRILQPPDTSAPVAVEGAKNHQAQASFLQTARSSELP